VVYYGALMLLLLPIAVAWRMGFKKGEEFGSQATTENWAARLEQREREWEAREATHSDV
jgi:hypothetical protein